MGVIENMEPLWAEAEKKGLLLECSYQDLLFTPKELRKAMADGRFRWGPVNWKLVKPQKVLNDLLTRSKSAEKHYSDLRNQLLSEGII